jgi:hypothetical protein
MDRFSSNKFMFFSASLAIVTVGPLTSDSFAGLCIFESNGIRNDPSCSSPNFASPARLPLPPIDVRSGGTAHAYSGSVTRGTLLDADPMPLAAEAIDDSGIPAVRSVSVVAPVLIPLRPAALSGAVTLLLVLPIAFNRRWRRLFV